MKSSLAGLYHLHYMCGQEKGVFLDPWSIFSCKSSLECDLYGPLTWLLCTDVHWCFCSFRRIIMFVADVCELCLASSNFSLPLNCPKPLPDLFLLDKHLFTSSQDTASKYTSQHQSGHGTVRTQFLLLCPRKQDSPNVTE